MNTDDEIAAAVKAALDEMADELYELYHSELDDASVRSSILGVSARIKHGGEYTNHE